MVTIYNFCANRLQPHPLPAFGKVKWLFVVGDGGQGLGFLDFLFLDEPCLFGLDFAEQVLRRALLGSLWHELSLDRVLEQALFHVVGEALCERVELGLCVVVGRKVGQERFNLGDNALLLGKRGKGNTQVIYLF